jgi:hypothetical protein
MNFLTIRDEQLARRTTAVAELALGVFDTSSLEDLGGALLRTAVVARSA